jgi:hypothetical protein
MYAELAAQVGKLGALFVVENIKEPVEVGGMHFKGPGNKPMTAW